LKDLLYFGTMAMLVKHIRHPDVLSVLKSLMSQLRELEKQGEVRYIHLMVTYFAATRNADNKEAVADAMKTLESAVNEDGTMTLFDYLTEKEFAKGVEKGRLAGIAAGIEKGRLAGIERGIERGRLAGIERGIERGIEEGELRAIHKIALRMLDKGFPLQEISDDTGLPLEEVKKLRGTVH
jgi:recombination-promoting nuclease RpnC